MNDYLWAPKFWMLLVENVLDIATNSSWFGDIDAADM